MNASGVWTNWINASTADNNGSIMKPPPHVPAFSSDVSFARIDRTMPRSQHTDMFFYAYATACGWGSVLELKIRLLADNTPALKHLAHANKLEDVEMGIVATFAANLQDGDEDLLAKARYLRNKVVHGNFSRAKAARVNYLATHGSQIPGDSSGCK